MRIDAVQVAASVAQAAQGELVRKSAAESAQSGSSSAAQAPVNIPKSRELSVSASFIENQVIVYRFVDKDTGDLIQQLPPEQMLQVMRSIDEMLNAESNAHQKIDIRS